MLNYCYYVIAVMVAIVVILIVVIVIIVIPPPAAARNASDHEVGCFVINTRLLLSSSLWSLLLTLLVAPLERGKGAGCPSCHHLCCGCCHHHHPHFCHHCRNHPPLSARNASDQGWLLPKKRGHPSNCHHCYSCHHHRCHHCCHPCVVGLLLIGEGGV